MEKTLKGLFDFQRFENNDHLSRLIKESENRYSRELSDDELEQVNAAGDFKNHDRAKAAERRKNL